MLQVLRYVSKITKLKANLPLWLPKLAVNYLRFIAILHFDLLLILSNQNNEQFFFCFGDFSDVESDNKSWSYGSTISSRCGNNKLLQQLLGDGCFSNWGHSTYIGKIHKGKMILASMPDVFVQNVVICCTKMVLRM